MLKSLKLKLCAPRVCAPGNRFREPPRSARFLHPRAQAGGCMAARGDENSMIVSRMDGPDRVLMSMLD